MISVALDDCSIHRSADAGIEIIDAAPRNRSFPLRLSEGLGLCLKFGPAHPVRFEGRDLSYPAETLCVRPAGSIWSSEDTGAVGFVSIDIEPSRLPDGIEPFAVTFVAANALPTFVRYARALAVEGLISRQDEITAALFVELDAAELLTADALHVSNARSLALRARDALLATLGRATAPTLDVLSLELGTNRFALMRAFKRAFGITPHAFLVGARLERARTQIARGVDLTTAAHEAGFSDQAHFTRAFKRSVGLTPGRYVRATRSRALLFKPAADAVPRVAAWKSSPSAPAEHTSPPTSTSSTRPAEKSPGLSSQGHG